MTNNTTADTTAKGAGGTVAGPFWGYEFVRNDGVVLIERREAEGRIDTLRAQLEARAREELRMLGQRNAARDQVAKLHKLLESAEARAEAAEAEAARLRGLLQQTAAVGITMLFDSHADDVRGEFSVGELMEVVAVSEPLNAQDAKVEKVYRTAWDSARTKEAAP